MDICLTRDANVCDAADCSAATWSSVGLLKSKMVLSFLVLSNPGCPGHGCFLYASSTHCIYWVNFLGFVVE